METTPLVTAVERALLAVDRDAVRAAVDVFLLAGPPRAVLDDVLVPALDRVGGAFEAGTASLSQVYMAGRIVEDLAARLLPPERAAKGPRVAVAVLEDRHVLGKRMVLAHLRAAGADVRDLGEGLSAAELATRVAGEGAAVVMISTLMLRSALAVADVIAGLRATGSRARVVVGGAPFRLDPGLWRHVGADACGRSAADAPHLIAPEAA